MNRVSQKLVHPRTLTSVEARCFGGGAPHDPNHKYVYHKSETQATQYKIPSQVDKDYQLPKVGTLNERLHQWIAGKWAVERDDVLDNTKLNKYSAYYHLLSNPVLRNPLVWQAFSLIGTRSRDADEHSAFGGVLTHENGIHLYKSNQARFVSMRQISDYAAVGFTLGFLTGYNPFMVMPAFLMAIQMPRKITAMNFFTWHAELLPHSEQVVFHKTTLFGAVDRHYVDIRNLEKIDSDQVNAPLMWQINMFDPDLCFRDASTGQIFVFDKNGHWNQEALEHPLLY